MEDSDLRVAGITDRGRYRSENQDTYRFAEMGNAILAAVCDGMGGAAGGRTASTLAEACFFESFDALYREKLTSGYPITSFDIKRFLNGAVYSANKAVHGAALSDTGLAGMGTTLTAVFVFNGIVCTANIGDSRSYLVTSGGIERLTHDHSYIQQLEDSGVSGEEISPSYRHIITRAVGVFPEVECDFASYRCAPGDRILLCSDGLCGVVPDEMLREIILSPEAQDPERAVRFLIDAADDRGSRDNITAVLIEI